MEPFQWGIFSINVHFHDQGLLYGMQSDLLKPKVKKKKKKKVFFFSLEL